MGFPVGYTDLFIPKLLVNILNLLSIFRKFINFILNFIGLEDFLDPEMSFHPEPSSSSSNPSLHSSSVSAMVIREMLPVVKFCDIIDLDDDPPESCAVCLYEFDADDEIRRLTNCRHIFHRCCLDRWMDHDQKTCPLCRMPFIPENMQEMFNEKVWVASGISDLYGDYSAITTGL